MTRTRITVTNTTTVGGDHAPDDDLDRIIIEELTLPPEGELDFEITEEPTDETDTDAVLAALGAQTPQVVEEEGQVTPEVSGDGNEEELEPVVDTSFLTNLMRVRDKEPKGEKVRADIEEDIDIDLEETLVYKTLITPISEVREVKFENLVAQLVSRSFNYSISDIQKLNVQFLDSYQETAGGFTLTGLSTIPFLEGKSLEELALETVEIGDAIGFMKASEYTNAARLALLRREVRNIKNYVPTVLEKAQVDTQEDDDYMIV